MRNCPICESQSRNKIKSHYSSVQWTLYRCKCGMLYLDSAEATEEGMIEYYRTVYQTDDDIYSDGRLEGLAQYIMENCNPPILDVGGIDGKLAQRILNQTDLSGAGDQIKGFYRTIIMSHTLEHVYNVGGMIENLKTHLALGGLIVIEVPIWNDGDNWQTYDYHFEHIQKFTSEKLEELFIRHGFEIELSMALPPYREYNCHRLVARK